MCRNCGGPLHSRNKFGYCTTTPECRKLHAAERYRVNGEKIRERAREWQRENERKPRDRQTARKWHSVSGPGWWHTIIDAYKTRLGCADCGFQSDRAGYFDLDHIDPSAKVTEISRLCITLSPRNPEHVDLFVAEVRKCRVLCVACHREKTVAERALLAGKRAMENAPTDRRCPHCGEMFTPHHGLQRYCSMECGINRRRLNTYPLDDF